MNFTFNIFFFINLQVCNKKIKIYQDLTTKYMVIVLNNFQCAIEISHLRISGNEHWDQGQTAVTQRQSLKSGEQQSSPMTASNSGSLCASKPQLNGSVRNADTDWIVAGPPRSYTPILRVCGLCSDTEGTSFLSLNLQQWRLEEVS